MGSANRARMDSSFINYCMALVDPGRQYWINIYEYSDSIFTSIYSTILFNDPLPIIDTTFISPTGFVYFTETGTSSDGDYLTVITANEGTVAMPVDLYPSTSFDYQRANYCMVGATQSSYYRFPVDPSREYYLSITSEDTSIANNINLYVYDDVFFLNELYSFPDTISNEFINIGQFPSGYIYVRADDYPDVGGSFYGATFIIDIRPIMP